MILRDMLVDTPIGPLAAEQFGDGEDLLLLHSLLTDRKVYDRVLPALSRRRRVTLIDLPGYGDSIAVRPRMADFADAVAGLTEALGLSPRLAMVGNGLGAFVSLTMAARHSDRVERLVLAGVAARFSERERAVFERMGARVLADGMSAVVEMALGRIFTEEYLAEHPDMAEERRQVLKRMDPAGFAAGCRAIRDFDFTGQLGGLNLPVLVVVGSNDQATPPSYGRAVASSIPGARYRVAPQRGARPSARSS